jgi:hypothetical protein
VQGRGTIDDHKIRGRQDSVNTKCCAMAMVSAPIPAFPRKRGKELNSGDDALPALPRPPPAGEGWDGGGMPMTDSQLFPFPRLRGKVGMGATFLQRANDVRDDIVDASQYFIIPVAPHAIPVLRQPLVACGIVGRIQMLTTVDFNYQSRRKANEIDDVRADRVLSLSKGDGGDFALFPAFDRPRGKLGALAAAR